MRVSTLMLLIVCDLFAGDYAGQAGSFLRLGLGPRSRGMGGTYTAIADNSTAAYYNAGGLGFLTRPEVSLTYSAMSFDRTFNSIGFSRPLPPSAGFSIGILQSGFTDTDARASNGDVIGSIHDAQYAVMMGFALRFSDRVAIGIAPKWLYSKVYDVSATSVGLDMGAMIKIQENLTFGLAIKEIGQKFKYSRDPSGQGDETTTDRIPVTIRGGAAYQKLLDGTFRSLLLTADLESTASQPTKIHLGLESNILDQFAVRIGLDDSDFTAGFSIPVSVRNDILLVEYAYIHDARMGVQTGTHDVGLSFQF